MAESDGRSSASSIPYIDETTDDDGSNTSPVRSIVEMINQLETELRLESEISSLSQLTPTPPASPLSVVPVPVSVHRSEEETNIRVVVETIAPTPTHTPTPIPTPTPTTTTSRSAFQSCFNDSDTTYTDYNPSVLNTNSNDTGEMVEVKMLEVASKILCYSFTASIYCLAFAFVMITKLDIQAYMKRDHAGLLWLGLVSALSYFTCIFTERFSDVSVDMTSILYAFSLCGSTLYFTIQPPFGLFTCFPTLVLISTTVNFGFLFLLARCFIWSLLTDGHFYLNFSLFQLDWARWCCYCFKERVSRYLERHYAPPLPLPGLLQYIPLVACIPWAIMAINQVIYLTMMGYYENWNHMEFTVNIIAAAMGSTLMSLERCAYAYRVIRRIERRYDANMIEMIMMRNNANRHNDDLELGIHPADLNDLFQ